MKRSNSAAKSENNPLISSGFCKARSLAREGDSCRKSGRSDRRLQTKSGLNNI